MNNKLSTSISPLEGRYRQKISPLKKHFSEAILIKKRIYIEIAYVIALSEFVCDFSLNKKEKQRLISWQKELQLKNLEKVKKIEEETHHDVKAVEYYIKNNLKNLGLEKISPWIHWGLTSEDVNNLSYALMIKGAKQEVLLPELKNVLKQLVGLAQKHSNQAMPGRTHGQIAVPTTLGKEIVYFASRLLFFTEKIENLQLGGKLNGAVGNFNAHLKIYPDKDWLSFSQEFVKKLGLSPTLITTQIEPNTRLVYLLDLIKQINNVCIDLCKDFWLYISYDYLVQKTNKKEVGSSTMPHKVNPINFENAEGNFQLANSFFEFLSKKLSQSRLQRDLSNSTVMRNIGVAFGHTLLALKSIQKGLKKIKPNKTLLKKEIKKHPEVLTEALQLILKKWGNQNAYKKIKKASRGKSISWQGLIKNLSLPDKKLKKLQTWKAEKYIGLALKLTKKEIKTINKYLKGEK